LEDSTNDFGKHKPNDRENGQVDTVVSLLKFTSGNLNLFADMCKWLQQWAKKNGYKNVQIRDNQNNYEFFAEEAN